VIEARFANGSFYDRNHHQPGQGSMAITPPCDPAQHSHNGATHMTANWKETLALGFVILAILLPASALSFAVSVFTSAAYMKPYDAQVGK
jgi:hypothetical protein